MLLRPGGGGNVLSGIVLMMTLWEAALEEVRRERAVMKRLGKVVAALAVAVCTMFAGAATANAESTFENIFNNPIALNNVEVSDVGAHTATVSFDYTIDPSQADQIKSLCFSVWVQRIIGITPIAETAITPNSANAEGVPYTVTCSGVHGESSPYYDEVQWLQYYGVYHEKLDQDGNRIDWWVDSNAISGTAVGQDFIVSDTVDFDGKLSGHASVPLEGLIANTTYTNNAIDDSGSRFPQQEAVQRELNKLFAAGVRTSTPVDIRQLVLHAEPIYKNDEAHAYSFAQSENTKLIPDITTRSEVQPAEVLPDTTDIKLEVANGTVTPGQRVRVYVNNLKEEDQDKADTNSLFWYAYIYSTPKALTSPDGAPFVRVQKEDNTGKYYFDAMIPYDLPAGKHRISLQDENGAVQAVTHVAAGDVVAPVVDKTALQGTVDAAGKLVEKDYTAASWAGFAQALKAAQGVIARQDATQADVDAAVEALADAQAGLQRAAGTSTQGSDDTKQHADDGSDKQSDADASGQSALAETGVSVAAIVGVLVALIVAGIGVTVTRKVRHEI